MRLVAQCGAGRPELSASVMESQPSVKCDPICSAQTSGATAGRSQTAEETAAKGLSLGRRGDALWPAPDHIRREINVLLYLLVT